MLNPIGIIEIPLYSFFHAYIEGVLWLPTKLSSDLGVVNGVAPVVAWAVSHKGYQILTLADGFDYQFDYLDIRTLIITANVVSSPLTPSCRTSQSLRSDR